MIFALAANLKVRISSQVNPHLKGSNIKCQVLKVSKKIPKEKGKYLPQRKKIIKRLNYKKSQ